MAYTPSLSEINQNLGPDINPTINTIDTSKFADLIVRQSKERMAKNEKDAVELKNNLSEAYKNVDPSKLQGVLEEDRPMLLNGMGQILDLLGSEPHALSNPNSPTYAKFHEKLNSWYADAAQSKLRKLTADSIDAQIKSNPDFNTEQNKNNLQVFKSNFTAGADQVIPIPKMVSPVHYFDEINKETNKPFTEIKDNEDGTIDEITGTRSVGYEERIAELFNNGKWYDGSSLGDVYTRDVYNNDKYLQENFPNDPLGAWKYQAEIFKNKEVVTKRDRQVIQNIPYLEKKSDIAQAEDNNNSLNRRREENNRSANDRQEKMLDFNNRIKEEEKKQEGELLKISFEAFKKIIDDSSDMDEDEKAQSIINVRNYLTKGTPLDEETTNKLIEAGAPTKPVVSNKSTNKNKKRTVTVNGITFDVE